MNKFKENYLNNLTDTVNNLLKRYSEGEKLSKDNFSLIVLYIRELRNLEKVTFVDKITSTYKQIQNMLNIQSSDNINKEEL